MKFINKVVIFVMGVVVIGVVATAIGVATRPKNVEKGVTFEFLGDNEVLSYNVFDKIETYAIYNEVSYNADNLVSISVNDDYNIFDTLHNSEGILEFMSSIDNGGIYLDIYNNNNTNSQGLNVGDIITITFEVEQETPVIIKTLLFLIPLVLSASLIGYLAFRKGENL